MIEEEFTLQECYDPHFEESMHLSQSHLLFKFALFCEKLYKHHIKLESAVIERGNFLERIACVTIRCQISGEAQNVAALMVDSQMTYQIVKE